MYNFVYFFNHLMNHLRIPDFKFASKVLINESATGSGAFLKLSQYLFITTPFNLTFIQVKFVCYLFSLTFKSSCGLFIIHFLLPLKVLVVHQLPVVNT